MILKLQRPLNAGAPQAVLIYDKTRKYQTTIQMTSALRKFFGGDIKVFAEGKVVPFPDGYTFALDLTQKLPDPNW